MRGRAAAWLLLATALALALSMLSAGGAGALTEESFVEKAQERPLLTVTGETLKWTATDPTNVYVVQRIRPNREPEYTVVKGTHTRPPALPGKSAGYRVRGATTSAWSREVQIQYPSATALSASPEGLSLLTEDPFEEPAEAQPVLTASGEVLKWEEPEPVAGTYLLKRTLPEREPEYAVVKALHTRPPAVPGASVVYRVKPLTGGTWSQSVTISYPTEEEQAEEEKQKEEPPEEGAFVNRLPTGPPLPAGGWHVAFADAFLLPLGSLPGEDPLWKLPSGYEPAEQSNDLNVYSASQVRIGLNGLELVAHHQLNVGGTGKNYVSGAAYTIGTFTLRSYAGATFAVECVCRWPHNAGAADPAFWHDGNEGGTEQEIDDFEAFGWNSDGSTEWGAAIPAAVHLGQHIVYHTEGVLKNFGFDPTLGFHRYTTVIGPGAAGKTKFSEYIDGVFKWSFEVTTPSTSVRQHLVLTYALREYPSRVPAGDTSFDARAVAVYEDGAHAGQFVTGGGIAPGTIVK